MILKSFSRSISDSTSVISVDEPVTYLLLRTRHTLSLPFSNIILWGSKYFCPSKGAFSQLYESVGFVSYYTMAYQSSAFHVELSGLQFVLCCDKCDIPSVLPHEVTAQKILGLDPWELDIRCKSMQFIYLFTLETTLRDSPGYKQILSYNILQLYGRIFILFVFKFKITLFFGGATITF